MAAIAGFPFHRGVLAAAVRPEIPGIVEYLSAHAAARSLVICAGLATSENLGIIARSAAAFGFDGLLLDGTCCDPYSRRTLKVSAGTILGIPVARGELPGDVVRPLIGKGFRITGAVPDARAVSLDGYRRAEKTAVVFWSEAEGLSEGWIRACDDLVTIPMRPGVDSLNVGVAAGIFMYALSSQEEPD